MQKYRVTVKYGNPGQYLSNSQTVIVEASSDATAMRLAVNKFKTSNPSYANKEAEAVKVEEL